MDLGLNGRAYLLTGAASGLGFATAECLVADGAKVLLSGRTETSLQAAASRLGPLAEFAVADNAANDTGQYLTKTCQRLFDRLDGALISVGGPPRGSVMETPDQAWRASFETVFLGSIRIAREVASQLPSGGSIIFVLSSSVKVPLEQMAISNGLRAGLAMVAKTLAEELGPRGIRVNALLPGRLETDRIRFLENATGDPEGARSQALSQIPLGRYGDPAEFGRTAAFLLSPAASYLSGVSLPVDGGMLKSL